MRPSRSRESGWRHPGNHEQRLRTARTPARRGRAGRGDWIGPRSIMGRSGHRRALEPKLEHGCGGTPGRLRIGLIQPPGRACPRSEGQRMNAPRTACGWLTRMFAAIGLIIVLSTVTPIDRWWAHAYSGPIEQPRGDVLILLSAAGDSEGGVSYSSFWRARYAVLAWQSGGFQKIVVSGGGGPGIANFLAAEGVPRQAIVPEWQSQSTHENGINTARLVANMPGRKVLLTSDFHMYRATRVFRKLGIQVIPMPIPDVLKSEEHWYARFPDFETLVLESVKIAYYKIHGWI